MGRDAGRRGRRHAGGLGHRRPRDARARHRAPAPVHPGGLGRRRGRPPRRVHRSIHASRSPSSSTCTSSCRRPGAGDGPRGRAGSSRRAARCSWPASTSPPRAGEPIGFAAASFMPAPDERLTIDIPLQRRPVRHAADDAADGPFRRAGRLRRPRPGRGGARTLRGVAERVEHAERRASSRWPARRPRSPSRPAPPWLPWTCATCSRCGSGRRSPRRRSATGSGASRCATPATRTASASWRRAGPSPREPARDGGRVVREQRRGGRIAMSSEERDAFLASERTCRVASIGGDGSPHVTPLWFAWDGTSLWLTSIVRSQRWTDLQRDNRVSVIVDAGYEFMELRGVELRGVAEIVGRGATDGRAGARARDARAAVRRQVRRSDHAPRRPPRLAPRHAGENRELGLPQDGPALSGASSDR